MAKTHSTGNGTQIPACTYIRMSSDKQDASPEQQRDEMAKLAHRCGCLIVTEYFDAAISGDATEKRKAFQKMIADAERGKFKVILCWDQDRFGRFDSIEAGRWIYPLRQAGVKLITVAQGVIDWTDFAGRMMYAIQQEGKHSFLRDLSRNSLRGRIRAASAGVWMTKPPTGYRVEHTRDARNRVVSSDLVPSDPQEVALVHRIFRDYEVGRSIRGIAFALNAERLYTRRGKPWAPRTVLSILRNRTYTGEYRWNVSNHGKYHAVRDGEVATDFSAGLSDESEWTIIPNHHEPLIEPARFKKVQQMLDERKSRTTPIQNGGQYVFTSIVWCGKCGARMYGAGGEKYPCYRCAGHANHNSCDRNTVQQHELLSSVLGVIEERFSDPAIVARLRERMAGRIDAVLPPVDLAALNRQLASLEADLTKARRNMALADDDEMRHEYEAVVREIRREREQIANAVQNAQKPAGRVQNERELRIRKAIQVLQRLRQAFDKAAPETRRELLRKTIERIEVWSLRPSGGPDRRYHMQRGVVYLRQDMWAPATDDLIPLN